MGNRLISWKINGRVMVSLSNHNGYSLKPDSRLRHAGMTYLEVCSSEESGDTETLDRRLFRLVNRELGLIAIMKPLDIILPLS